MNMWIIHVLATVWALLSLEGHAQQGEDDIFRQARRDYTFSGDCESRQSLELDFASSGASQCHPRKTVRYSGGRMECAFWNNGLSRFVPHNVEPQCKSIDDMGNSRLVEWDGTFVEGSMSVGPSGLEQDSYRYVVVDAAASALGRSSTPALPDHPPVSLQSAVLRAKAAAEVGEVLLLRPVRMLVLVAARCSECPSDLLDNVLLPLHHDAKHRIQLTIFTEDPTSFSNTVPVLSYADIGVQVAEMRTNPVGLDWVDSMAAIAAEDRSSRELISLFANFDVVVYNDVGWKRPRDIGRLVNLAWLSQVPKLIRIVTADTVLHSAMPQYFSDGMWYPAHEYLADSHLHARRLHLQVQLGGRVEQDTVQVLPPVLDEWLREAAPHECFDTWPRTRHVLFVGNGHPVSSPGAALRLTAALRQAHPDVFASLRFTMIGVGTILDEMIALRAALGLKETVVFVAGTTQQQWVLALSTADLLVDPCPTDASNAFAYPAASSFQLPILAFASSAASETLLLEQTLLVSPTSIPIMADALAALYSSANMPHENMAHQAMFSAHDLCAIQAAALSGLYAPALAQLGVLRSIESAMRAPAIEYPTPISVLAAATAALSRESPDSHYDSALSNNNTGLTRLMEASARPSHRPPFSLGRFHSDWKRGLQPDVVLDDISVSNCSATWLDESDMAVLNAMRTREGDEQVPARATDDDTDTHTKSGRILCAVYSLSESRRAIEAVLDTWGKRCDGFIAFSDVDDPDINAVATNHPGGEAYSNMWRKVQEAWLRLAIAQERHRGEEESGTEGDVEEYDWFIMGGDDMYVDIASLRAYLGSSALAEASAKEVPLYLGRAVREGFHHIYHNGGAGYVLNRAAMIALADEIASGKCFRDLAVNVEDLLVGLCLARQHIFPLDTADALGRERFHWHRPGVEFNGVGRLFNQLSVATRTGPDCCSPQSTTFHYVNPVQVMYCVDAVLRA